MNRATADFLVGFAAFCVCLRVGAEVSLAAPVPRVKPAARPALAGQWRLRWGGFGGDAVFRPDGTHRYSWGPNEYEGGWDLKGDTLTLTDRDVTARWDEPWYQWEVTLEPGKLRGRDPMYEGEFELLPPRKDR
jgi:hypothetical protein